MPYCLLAESRKTAKLGAIDKLTFPHPGLNIKYNNSFTLISKCSQKWDAKQLIQLRRGTSHFVFETAIWAPLSCTAYPIPR